MKRFVNFITAAIEWVKAHTAARVLFYGLVVLALLLIYFYLDTSEVSFIYNEF